MVHACASLTRLPAARTCHSLPTGPRPALVGAGCCQLDSLTLALRCCALWPCDAVHAQDFNIAQEQQKAAAPGSSMAACSVSQVRAAALGGLWLAG